MPPIKDDSSHDPAPDPQRRLQQLIDERSYRHWFQGKTQLVVCGDELRVTVGNPYLLTWIQKRFQPTLRALAIELIGPEARLRLDVDASVVTEGAPEEQQRPKQKSTARQVRSARPSSTSEQRRRVYADLKDFVSGGCNDLAYAAARQVAADPSAQYNPLFLYGGVGNGKTHLLEGIHQQLRRRHPRLQSLLLTAENFGNYFSRALADKTLPSFRQRFRNVDVLLVDDVDFFDGKRGFQEEFLHTFKKLECEGRQIIVSSGRHPRLLAKTSDELASRYLAGLVCRIEPPDPAIRSAYVRQRAARMKLPIDDRAIDFVADRFTTNVRELAGAVNCLHTWHVMTGRRVGVSAAREVLAALERDCIRIVRIADIDGAVCKLFGVTSEQLKSPARSRDVTQPRMLAMYLARRMTRAPYSEIGRYFGGRNHATVMSAERKTARLLEQQASISVSADEWPLADVLAALQQQVLAG